jgi:hypothetical protein
MPDSSFRVINLSLDSENLFDKHTRDDGVILAAAFSSISLAASSVVMMFL